MLALGIFGHKHPFPPQGSTFWYPQAKCTSSCLPARPLNCSAYHIMVVILTSPQCYIKVERHMMKIFNTNNTQSQSFNTYNDWKEEKQGGGRKKKHAAIS